jgi:hypothetical protein
LANSQESVSEQKLYTQAPNFEQMEVSDVIAR